MRGKGETGKKRDTCGGRERQRDREYKRHMQGKGETGKIRDTCGERERQIVSDSIRNTCRGRERQSV